MENEDPQVTQGQQPEAETPSNNVSNGVQARIDELTAKFRETERVVAEKDAQIAALIQAQLSTQSQYQPQPNLAPQVEIDPEEAKKYDAYLGPKLKAMEQLVQRLEQAQVQNQFQQFQNQAPPEVVKRAQELQLAWQRSGKTGWVAQDALTFAYGEYNLKQAQQGNARNEQRAFNQASRNVSMQAAPSPVQDQNNTGYKLPQNIDELPLKQRIALREQALKDVPWE